MENKDGKMMSDFHFDPVFGLCKVMELFLNFIICTMTASTSQTYYED